MDLTRHIHTTGFGALDIRSKGFLFLLFMIWTVLFTHPACHAVMGGLILWTGMRMGVSVKQMVSRLVPLLPLFILIFVFTGFSKGDGFLFPENKVPLITFWETLSLTRGGLLMGLTFLLRLVNMVVFTLLILKATPLDDFIHLFIKLRLSRTLSFIITTAIRFVPKLDKKRELIIMAQRARGIDLNEGSRLRQFKARIAVMIPLIVNAIVIADQLTMALMNRGFGYRNQWTVLSRMRLNVKDYIIITGCMAGSILGVLIRYRTGWGMI